MTKQLTDEYDKKVNERLGKLGANSQKAKEITDGFQKRATDRATSTGTPKTPDASGYGADKKDSGKAGTFAVLDTARMSLAGLTMTADKDKTQRDILQEQRKGNEALQQIARNTEDNEILD